MLNNLIEKYSESITGSWLNDFPWGRVKIKPLKFGVEGIMTAAYLALSDTLKVAEDRSDDVFFGSLIHEFFHAYQRHAMGLVKYLLIKTFRRKKLEAPAKQAELNATRWIGEYKIQKWKENKRK